MKKVILICLLTFTLASFFSFTVNPENSSKGIVEGKVFKTYFIALGNAYPIPETNCTITVGVVISFNWNGPGTPITNVTVSTPQFTVNCGGAEYSKTSEVTTLDIENQEGHTTDIEFSVTEDELIDRLLADPIYIKSIRDNINAQVDLQRP